MSAAAAVSTGHRRALLAKVHLGRKDLGLDEDTYRALLQRVTGRTSAADCSAAQLGDVLDDMKAKGFKARPASSKGAAHRRADHPVAGKARALWISLHQLGAVRDPGERALEAFAKRQLKAEKLQWADQALGYKLVEALKAMALKAGWDASEVVGEAAPTGHEALRVVKVRLVKAQWSRLTQLGAIKGGEAPHCSGLANWGAGARLIPGVRSVEFWPAEALTTAAQRLGVWIWEATPVAGPRA